MYWTTTHDPLFPSLGFGAFISKRRFDTFFRFLFPPLPPHPPRGTVDTVDRLHAIRGLIRDLMAQARTVITPGHRLVWDEMNHCLKVFSGTKY